MELSLSNFRDITMMKIDKYDENHVDFVKNCFEYLIKGQNTGKIICFFNFDNMDLLLLKELSVLVRNSKENKKLLKVVSTSKKTLEYIKISMINVDYYDNLESCLQSLKKENLSANNIDLYAETIRDKTIVKSNLETNKTIRMKQSIKWMPFVKKDKG